VSKEPITFLLVASYEKGHDFMLECKQQGCRVLLLTLEALKERPWPRDSIDEIFYMRDFSDNQELIRAVAYLARFRQIDRIVPLDDYDVEKAAVLREHLRIPGMGDSTARFFRDKLAMRVRAQDAGVPVPEFVPVVNYERIREFMARVPGPWMLKPRSEAAAIRIFKIHSPDELWPVLDNLGDAQSYFVLERYVPGSVYHVDAITYEKEILLAEGHRYGAPPFNIVHNGGVFTSHTLPRETQELKDLLAIHREMIQALRFVRGVTHSEFIKSSADGKFYFLETAARVGGAYIADVVEAATGVNLWREWAKIEIAGGDASYKMPEPRKEYGGIVLSLARQEWPDTSHYNAPEIDHPLRLRHHAGLILRSTDPVRIHGLLDDYCRRFFDEFYTSEPAPDRATI
jgi:biotin carboxylase